MKKKIAIIVPGLELGGGVPTVAAFLYETIQTSIRYKADLISLSTSARDRASLRLLAPNSWKDGIQTVTGVWRGYPFVHVGAAWTEFEFQRYKPRCGLTNLLNEYDLIQIVAGTPAFAWVTAKVEKPKCAFFATLIRQDRANQIAMLTGTRRYWSQLMTCLNARIEKQSLRLMQHVFAESFYTERLLRAMVSPKRLSLGMPGVDIGLFYPQERYASDSYILAVGRLADPRKNLRLLLTAYKLLCVSDSVVPRLVLAGINKPSAADWAFAEAQGIASAIDVYHNVSRGVLADLYRNAALFVLSSDEEGLGMVILEAMASGIPVVSTRCGGPETAVIEGETGYLTPVGDANALAEKIQYLLERPTLREQMGRRARQVVEEKFSLEAAGRVYLQKYDELLS